MVNLNQIRLKLAMDHLGVRVDVSNYHNILNVCYEAEQRGIHISPSEVLADNKGYLFSPRTHENAGCPPQNLLDDVVAIQTEWNASYTDFTRWTLDADTLRKLDDLKTKLKLGVVSVSRED